MQNTGSGATGGGKFAMLAAIITAIAGIITAIVSISGPLLDKKMAIAATQTREAVLSSPTKVSTLVPDTTEAGDTPTPGNSAAAAVEPTRTEKPALLAATNTPAPAGNGQPKASASPSGTVLKVGESYTASSGISVKLTDIEVPAGNEVHLHFTFTNPTTKVMNISLNHNRDVTLTNDKGDAYTWLTDFTWAVSIYPGTSRNDEVKRRGDVSRAGYFVVKLDIPGMISAQWKK